ncbi:hypothetical protein [Streptomyces sp. NRRL S-98]|uniref:hypothetical protein n=1 Tax=Streptomyces sp. NRRL S-98 TaxID=1463922 RepID=UPI00131BD0E4|nr:hypothetical protein [Streptomyces sp. NRRL S-98]
MSSTSSSVRRIAATVLAAGAIVSAAAKPRSREAAKPRSREAAKPRSRAAAMPAAAHDGDRHHQQRPRVEI